MFVDIMRLVGIYPNVMTYNIVNDSLIIKGFTNEAKHILDELVRMGVSPDMVTFTTIIYGLSKKRHFKKAFFCLVLHERIPCEA